MGFTALIMQTFAGDAIDKTTMDRRIFLAVASILTAMSASTIFFVREGNQDHALIFISKVIEGISSSFIGPCLAALTLATFGPHHFDTLMASNIMWGHIGSIMAAGIAGLVAYLMYPDIKMCFLVISAAALAAVFFVQYLPQGDPQMGRGFHGKVALDEFGRVETLDEDEEFHDKTDLEHSNSLISVPPIAATYWKVISNRRSLILCLTGFFFHFANANVLLVLGELMGENDNEEEEGPSRAAIPLIAGAIVLAQVTMAVATWLGQRLMRIGVGRKPLFMAGILTLPLRCALIIYWKDSGSAYLLSTQILDGLGGGFFGLLHPILVADITFGTGRFNLLSKYRRIYIVCILCSSLAATLHTNHDERHSGIDCFYVRYGRHPL
jgi:MFS family permease